MLPRGRGSGATRGAPPLHRTASRARVGTPCQARSAAGGNTGRPAPSHHHESLVIDPGRGPARGAARAVAGGVPRRGTGRARRSARGGRADPQARRTLAGAAPRDLRRTRRGAGARPHRAPPAGAGAPGPDVAPACAGMERGPRAGGGPGLARGRAGVVRRSRGPAPHGARGAAAPLPATVAVLAGLLVTTTPVFVLRDAPGEPGESRRLHRLARPHLPKGAQTSPPRREPAGPRSGPEAHGSAAAVGAGTAVTRTAPRREYDVLRALLHNCARTGPDAQNRAGHPAFRDHLLGRIAWVESGSPARGARPRELFAEIPWSQIGCGPPAVRAMLRGT